MRRRSGLSQSAVLVVAVLLAILVLAGVLLWRSAWFQSLFRSDADNAAAVVDITSKSFPEEAEDKEFTQALVEETQLLYELPDEADGQWGTAVPEFVERYMNFLVDQGELEEPVDPDVFVNDHVEAYNDFDEDEIKADAGTGG